MPTDQTEAATPAGAATARSRNVLWVVVWVGLSLAFGLWVLAVHGRSAAAEYYAAYFLEKSLSIDNIFVFVIIFSELHIPPEYQRRVLRFGIAGALVFRALVISAGIALSWQVIGSTSAPVDPCWSSASCCSRRLPRRCG